MRNFKLYMAALLVVGFASFAFADGYDLAYRDTKTFPVTTTAPTTGDQKLIFVAADNKWELYTATTEKLAGSFNGTVGATTPAAGTFTTLTASGVAALNGANTSTGSMTYTKTPSADSGSTDYINRIVETMAVDTTGTNTHNGYSVALTAANATGGTNTYNGYNFANYTGDAQVNVNAINIGTSDALGTANAIKIGTGWDVGLLTDSGVTIGSTNGTNITSLILTNDAVANGQTSKTTTVTGATASSKCFATPTVTPTNAVYIKSVVAGTNQAVITTSGDPGASTLTYNVLCLN